ncbi:MAG TPA: M20/M25/M40 family metallo-hydrolase [Bryobacteraceae bacterium]|nr:M20/M25/M40 family metallo-hydrolase [Bryobacteraceae bacterium]
MRDVLRWFTREKQWVNDIHLRLCRVPAPTFLERERAEWFAAQLRLIGWHAWIDAAGNVLSSLEPPSGDRLPASTLVALTAHLDTVLAPRTKEDIYIDRDGDMQGPGVSDNGAGLAALLAIAKAIKATADPATCADLWSRLLLIANVGEEGEGNLCGIRHVCAQPELVERIRAFLVLDGAATDHVTVQALGSRRFEVSFTGAGGHSWSDFGVANPVHALNRSMTSFIDDKPVDPRSSPKVSVNVGLIEGGTGINAIPSVARAKIDIRSEDNDRMEELVQALRSSVAFSEKTENARATGAKVTARVREIGSRPAAALPADSPLIAMIRSVDSHLGIRSRLDCASTDANIPLSLGIPAVSIGAGGKGGGAHTISEWYRSNGRDLGLKRVMLLAGLLLRDNGNA